MNLLTRRQAPKKIRDVIYDERAVNKAVRASIRDQKAVTKEAEKIRAQLVH